MEAELKATRLTPPAMAEPPLKPRETPRTLCCLAIMAERVGSCDARRTEAKQGPGCECQSPWPLELICAGAEGLGFRGIKGKIRSIPGLGRWHRPIFLAPVEHVTKHTFRSHWEGTAYGSIPPWASAPGHPASRPTWLSPAKPHYPSTFLASLMGLHRLWNLRTWVPGTACHCQTILTRASLSLSSASVLVKWKGKYLHFLSRQVRSYHGRALCELSQAALGVCSLRSYPPCVLGPAST